MKINQIINEFAPAGSGGGTPPRGPRTPDGDPWGGNDGGEDPYGRPEPEYYSRSIDYFGRFEADHFDDEVFDKATGVFKGYWDDEEGRVQIGYFKFDDPQRTGSDDPGMGWYYEPQNESVADLGEGWKQNLAAMGLAGLTALSPTPAAAEPAQTSTVSTTVRGVSGDQIVNHKNYQKYYDQALAGRNTARAHQTAQQIATLKVKADIAKGINEQGMSEELAMKHQRSHSTQKYADTSSSLADRSFGQAERDNVPRTADGHPTVKYRFDGKAGHTRVDPTITPTSVKRKDSDRPIPAFLKKDVDEGWKDVVAGGAMALGALGAQAQTADLSGYNTQYLQQVAAGEHARPMVSVDDAKAELQARANGKQTVAPATKPQASSGYSKEYLQKAADPDRFGRYMISVEKAQELLRNMQEDVTEAKPREREADYGADYQDMVARLKQLAGQGPRKTVWDAEKRVYKTVPRAEQPKK
jgi:hypothetical protein